MSDTPRTDAIFGGHAATDDGYWKALDFARVLERENAALREDNTYQRQRVKAMLVMIRAQRELLKKA